jgi:hypothetical protein
VTDPGTQRMGAADNARWQAAAGPRPPGRRRTGCLLGPLIVLAVALVFVYFVVLRPERQKQAAADSLNDRPSASAVKAGPTRRAVLSGAGIRLLAGDPQSPLAHTTDQSIYFDGAEGASVVLKSTRPYDDCQNVAYSTDPWLEWDEVWTNTALCVKWQHSGRRHLTVLTVDSATGSTAKVEIADWSWKA